MDARAEDTHRVVVIEREDGGLTSRDCSGIHPAKSAPDLGNRRARDIPLEVLQGNAHPSDRLREAPPILPVARTANLVALRFHRLPHDLEGLWKMHCFLKGHEGEIDH